MEKKLIIILGMHRSGSSAITRLLMTMGISLGKNLISGVPGINDLGFWEDREIVFFNEEILNLLNDAWHFPTEIDDSQIKLLADAGYVERARNLLSNRLTSYSIFAFKDPRTLKLLKFWKHVIDTLKVEANYIITTRSPLSVAKSLNSRDGFTIEHGLSLWMTYYLSAIDNFNQTFPLVIRYEDVLESPTKAAELIAAYTGCKVDSFELNKYLTEFLHPSFNRHGNNAEDSKFQTNTLYLCNSIEKGLVANSEKLLTSNAFSPFLIQKSTLDEEALARDADHEIASGSKTKYIANINLSAKNNAHTVTFERVFEHACGRKLKILEVGCSSGYFGSALMSHGHEVWGVEPFKEAAYAAKNVLSYVHHGTIDSFFDSHPTEKFDAIIFGDVLEHLSDPSEALRTSSRFLKSDGTIIASIPNVAHSSIRAMLLEGRWEYSNLGIMDDTHLRFFTRSTIVDLFAKSGFNIASINPVRLTTEEAAEISGLQLQKSSIEFVKNHTFDNRGTDFQYIVYAKRISNQPKLFNADSIKIESGPRILCLVSDISSSIVDIRLRWPLQRWSEIRGGNYRIASIFDSNDKDLAWADAVVFQRDANEYILSLASFLQSNGKKVIFEIDDLLIELPEFLSHHAEGINRSLPFIQSMLEKSDAISTSNDLLKSRLTGIRSAAFIIPNYSLPMPVRATHTNCPPESVTLIVASSDKVLVDMLIEPLSRLQQEMGVKIVAIGPPGEKLQSEGLKVERIKNLSHLDFKSYLSTVSNGVGVIPLDGSTFSSCKSPVKFFDYAMSGIPSICSNVLPYKGVVAHEKNGLLVDNDVQSWISALKRLILDPGLREELSKSAQKSILEHYNLDVAAGKWGDLIDSLALDFSGRNLPSAAMPANIKPLSSLVKTLTPFLFNASSYKTAFGIVRRYGIKELISRINKI